MKEDKEAFARLSSSLQRPELPRARKVNKQQQHVFSLDNHCDAEALIRAEMARGLAHDAAAFPVQGQRRDVEPLCPFADDQMAVARAAIEAECQDEPEFDVEADMATFEKLSRDIVFVPSRRGFASLSELNKKDRLQVLQQDLELKTQHLAREVQRAQKAQERCHARNGSFAKKTKEAASKLVFGTRELQQALIDLSCFEALHAGEQQAIPARIQRLREELEEMKQCEHSLQNQYKELQDQRERLMQKVAAAK